MQVLTQNVNGRSSMHSDDDKHVTMTNLALHCEEQQQVVTKPQCITSSFTTVITDCPLVMLLTAIYFLHVFLQQVLQCIVGIIRRGQ